MASFDQLIQLIRDTSQPIATRRAAVAEILNIGGDEAYPHLVTALSDPAPGVRREAANALQIANFVQATAALVETLKNEDSDLTRWSLIEALGKIGTVSALPTLETFLNEELSPLTRREIQKSIDLINTRHPDAQVSDKTEETYINQEVSESERELSDTSGSDLNQENLRDDITVDDRQIVTTESEEDFEDIPDDAYLIDEENTLDEPEATSHDTDIDTEEMTPEVTADERTLADTASSDSENVSDTFVDVGVDVDVDVEPETEQGGVDYGGRTTSAPALPVLVPNTSVVIYEQDENRNGPSIYSMVLRPNMYLSKRWVSRSRLYFTLLFLLLGATIALIYSQVKRQPRSPYKPNVELVYLENPDDYLATGSLYMQQGDYRRAIEEFEFVRGVESMDSALYKNLGDAYFLENQYAHAVEAYEYYLEAREIEPYQLFVAEASFSTNSQSEEQQISSDYKIYNMLGTAYRFLCQYDKAQAAFEKAVALAPKESEAFRNLAVLYSDGYEQRPKLTLGLAYAAIKLNPFVASSHDIIGWTLGKDGRYNSATNALDQAYRLQSDFLPMLYHYSEIAEKTRFPDKTLEFVEKDLQQKIRQRNITRADILDVLSYIYENESQKYSRFSTSLYKKRRLK